MEKLMVSADGRGLVTASGKPFFYLADTAWTMPQRLKWDDALYYMNRRKMQGFTALQVVALDPERDEQMRNPIGISALRNDDLLSPNQEYFTYLDWLLATAEQMGFYVTLLPVWGQLVVGENWSGQQFPKTVTPDNSYEFGRWIGHRYRDHANIIWCLGGDRQPIHKGVDYRDLWRRMAEGIAKGVTGRDAQWNEPGGPWDEILITYHTCYEMETGYYSTMSYWTEDDVWLSFTMLQSGHGLTTRNYVAVREEIERQHRVPVIDAEPAYELMPMNWPGPAPLHDDWIVRKRAYWSLLAGSCGHAYGHASVWCMISEKERNAVLVDSWFEALERPGAQQMKVLRDLVESVPFDRLVPDQGMLAHGRTCGDGCLDGHRQAARDLDGRFALVYFTNGGSELVDLDVLGGTLNAIWFNPRDGKTYDNEMRCTRNPIALGAKGKVELRAPSYGDRNDWLLVLAADHILLRSIGIEREWAVPFKQEEMPMIWA